MTLSALTPGRRTRTRWTYLTIAVAGALAILWGAILLGPHHTGAPDPVRIVVISLASGLSIAWTFVFATLAYRQLDEYQRAASKFAWYWGGVAGLAASLPVYVFVQLGGLHWLDPAHFHLGLQLALAFQLGYGLAVVSMLLGFLVALGVWRITRR